MIHKQLTTFYKVKYGSIFIGYNKSHGIGIKVIYGSVIGQLYGLL